MNDRINVKSFSDMPGPWGIPFFGSLPELLGKQQGQVLMEWAEQYYGPVFRLRLGSRQVVALQGYEAIKEALEEKVDSFSGRMSGDVIDALRGGKGLFFTDFGKHWKIWHSFAIQSLNAVWETALRGVFTEALYLDDYLTENLSQEIDLSTLMPLVMMNPIFQMSFSTRYDVIELKDMKIYDQVYGSVANPKFKPLLFLPWLKYFPSFGRFVSDIERSRINHINWLKILIKERRNNTDNNSIDLVTCYEQSYQDFQVRSKVSEDDFASLIADMLFAGSSTTANQFLWTLLLLLKHPSCMEKLQDELSSVIKGKFSTESLSDLPYTQAVLHETQRLRPIAPISSIHKTTHDTSVMGCAIPKGTDIITNLWSVHMDKTIWGPDPEAFRPDRHLDHEGNFHKSKYIIPHTMGLRKCVGERLAKVEILTFLVTCLLKYKVRLADESKDVDMAGLPDTIWKPKPFKVIVSPK